MRTIYYLFLFTAILAAAPAVAEDNVDTLHAQLRAATTPEQRRAVLDQIKQAQKASRPAAAPVDQAARRARQEEALKNDPERLEEYRLRESMRAAATPEARAAIRKQLEDRRAARVAKAEAALTPQQKAARSERASKAAAKRSEMKPLIERLRTARTEEERSSARAAIRAAQEK